MPHVMAHGADQCIQHCLACAETCTAMAMGHCLDMGGEHIAHDHLALMLGCAEMCRSAATIMQLGARQHGVVCLACAQLCEACAEDCARLGGMDACVAACRQCAESCRRMAEAAPAA